MSVQVIRPAGAGHETLYVFLLALAIVLLAGAVVVWRAEPEQSVAIAADQFDARRDLNAAEQGIHTDLLVALDEIHLYREEAQALPEPQFLAEEGFPPFIADASAANRGGHAWQLLQTDTHVAYFGRSAAEAVAGSFLLRLDGDNASVWLNRAAQAEAPNDLREQVLADTGWRQVASQFDAGVTRQHRH
ncbi:DUF6162 family protein [Ectopseudomonas composti]|jgi:hypothetical protein|uniref:Periplasmic protein n=1 Tax=Ectopseudomonas composti TaxID=658457 RepID=A0A1I5QNW7_9GAMM|nr:DUF6162 family protein [Pseudomonas composti]EZH76875.1 hypothetical protein AU05_02650 [Pseudomonas composti]SFP47800.1 hypothetical protein SAMN05216601_112135 [Pseudomonas composti]